MSSSRLVPAVTRRQERRMANRPDWVPLIVLTLIAALLAGGYFVYPRFFALIHRTDCIATGRTDCG
ncbi:hypothetical protein Asru_0395_02 [Acidisphaera rubrifaciens HS-AP3]|uniref:Uncharacterized protein n=1 Tax=Acidisphaera rubrifaciens HS-AP3 TaxID=1231350 RepID=A0A0D6P8U6_9PROT|nr:hypothetical protein Asru_0395_02 [Acidisphaera rubrifaciens HS-AP3]